MEAVSVGTLLLHPQGRGCAGFRRDVRWALRVVHRAAPRASRRPEGRRQGQGLRKRDCLSATRKLPDRRPLRDARRSRRSYAALHGAQVEARGRRALRSHAQASYSVHAAPHRHRDERGRSGHTRHVHGADQAFPEPRDTALPRAGAGRRRPEDDHRRHRVLQQRGFRFQARLADCRARRRELRGPFLLQRRVSRPRRRGVKGPYDLRRRPRDGLYAMRLRRGCPRGDSVHRRGDGCPRP